MKKKYLSLLILPLLVIGVSSCDSIVIMDSRDDINPTDPNKTSEEDPNNYSIEVVSYPSSVEVGKSSPLSVNLITETEDETIIEEGTNANLVLISSDSSTLSVSKTSIVGVKVGQADLTVRWVSHPDASVTIEDIEVVIGYTYDISLSYYITPEEDDEDEGDGNTGDNDNDGDDGDDNNNNDDDDNDEEEEKEEDNTDDTDNDDNDTGDNEGEGNDDDNTDDDDDDDEDDEDEDQGDANEPEEASSITIDIEDTLSLYDFTIRLGTLEDDGENQNYTQVVFTDEEYEGNDTVKFISTDEEVLQVSEDGESVTALSSGRAYLSVMWVDHDVSSNTILINVNAAPEPEPDPDDPNGSNPDDGNNPDGDGSQGEGSGNQQDDD